MRQIWKVRLLPLLLAMGLLLSACGGKGQAAYDPSKTAEALLDSSAFTQALDTLDGEIACQMYGVDFDGVTECVAYASLSAGSEGFAVITFQEEKAAEAALEALQAYVDGEKEAQAGYQPQEVPKLDSAILDRRGSSVVLVVAGDAAAAQSALDGLS